MSWTLLNVGEDTGKSLEKSTCGNSSSGDSGIGIDVSSVFSLCHMMAPDFESHGGGNGTSVNLTVTAEPGGSVTVPEPPLYVLVTVTSFYVLIFLGGLAGNSLVIFVVCKNRGMRSYTNCLLVNLSVADILVITVCMPSAFTDLFLKEVWYLGAVMCRLIPLVENAVALSSVLTILAISFERHHAICHPLKVQYTCTFRRMFVIIMAIWLIAFGICTPFSLIAIYKDSFLVDGTPIKVCRTYVLFIWQEVFVFCWALVFFLLPFVLLIVLYAVIGHKIISGNTDISLQLVDDQLVRTSYRGRRQCVLMLATIVLLFFVCLLPIQIVRLWSVYASRDEIMRLGFEGRLNLIYFARVMFYLNSAINPLCYNLMSTKFRCAFRRAVRLSQSGPASNSHSHSRLSSDIKAQQQQQGEVICLSKVDGHQIKKKKKKKKSKYTACGQESPSWRLEWSVNLVRTSGRPRSTFNNTTSLGTKC